MASQKFSRRLKRLLRAAKAWTEHGGKPPEEWPLLRQELGEAYERLEEYVEELEARPLPAEERA